MTRNLCGSKGPSDCVSFRRAVIHSDFIHLKDFIQSQEQHRNIFYKPYTITNRIFIRSPIKWHPFTSEWSMTPSIVCLRKGFHLHDTQSPIYDIFKMSHWSKTYVKPQMIYIYIYIESAKYIRFSAKGICGFYIVKKRNFDSAYIIIINIISR